MLIKRSRSEVVTPQRRQLLPPEQRGKAHKALSVRDLPVRVHRTYQPVVRVPEPPNNTLNAVQREILLWLANGKRPIDVADILDMKANAVHQHIHKMKDKLGANTQAGLVARAFIIGLISVIDKQES